MPAPARILATLALLAGSSQALAAPNNTPVGNITKLAGGWVSASVRVQTAFAWTNPESCPTTDGYVVDPGDSGHELFSAMLLSAFMSRRPVQLTIDGCSNGRPRIIGIELAA